MKKVTLMIIVISIFIILIICNYKKLNLGNNIISKTSEEITSDILNIKSYKANVEITVKSNKNENVYKLKQEYSNGNSMQEVIEDNDIGGITISNSGNTLNIKNTKLNLEKIYENYEWITNNQLFLNTFIEDYKTSTDSKSYEEDKYIILETNVANKKNKYICTKKLYIDKETQKIEKMELLDSKQKGTIYILYNEIELSN